MIKPMRIRRNAKVPPWNVQFSIHQSGVYVDITNLVDCVRTPGRQIIHRSTISYLIPWRTIDDWRKSPLNVK